MKYQGHAGARWMKFNLVGAIGIGVQLGALALFTSVLRLDYLWATAVAVEATVLHNFAWHERFTWVDRSSRQWHGTAARLLRFNLTTGVVSIGGNLLAMRFLVGQVHLPAVIANLASIAICSVLNYLVSDRWVFRASTASTQGNAHRCYS